ncbi:MAG: diacylglycerol kinase family lipid kinase [Verrucomicrobia bacterium]|nr:diacylglycerol kinase family lipid kinase [Verrucomicrobiota bacterium]
MRTCIIFNPTARGERAQKLRSMLNELGGELALRPTTGPGVATLLASEAVREGFDTIIAAGGDGTVNEVLNGIASAPDGLNRARLAVLPLGTVNVFARELGISTAPARALEQIRHGREIQIDLPLAAFANGSQTKQRHFIQLAGAGLDARAIELASFALKKKFGPFAYVVAGLQALSQPPTRIAVSVDGQRSEGELIIICNGRFYGGSFNFFPDADLQDGRLDVCVFPRTNFFTLLRCGLSLLLGRIATLGGGHYLRGESIDLSSASLAPFELEGENVGHAPVQISVRPKALRVIRP